MNLVVSRNKIKSIEILFRTWCPGAGGVPPALPFKQTLKQNNFTYGYPRSTLCTPSNKCADVDLRNLWVTMDSQVNILNA